MKNAIGDRKARFAAEILAAMVPMYQPDSGAYQAMMKDLNKLTVNTLYLLTSGIKG
ncbi:hypothetical protein LCGC14_2862150 [marine sediment metagenome]|uniref:Uncharacterized protein n=1 Tax=marine sediment metagenome TaxID=412755 RepID=A0A0F8Y5L5_9ZZZZ